MVRSGALLALVVGCGSFSEATPAPPDAGGDAIAVDAGATLGVCGTRLEFTERAVLDGSVTSLVTADGLWATTTTKVFHAPAGKSPVEITNGKALSSMLALGGSVAWRDDGEIHYLDAGTSSATAATSAQLYVSGTAALATNGTDVFFGSAYGVGITQLTPEAGKGTSVMFNTLKLPRAIAVASGMAVAVSPIGTLAMSIIGGASQVGSAPHVILEDATTVVDLATDGARVYWIASGAVSSAAVSDVKTLAPQSVASIPGAKTLRLVGDTLWITTGTDVIRMPKDGSCQERATMTDTIGAIAVGPSDVFVGVGRRVLSSPR